ncbi:rhomboid family intramembrane serine protease [Aestuariicella sp. G3-2]|uniref:rhomboid family intramembrane serine protease n=1 Tax=Pseudomaricurvus albidus TaxID=2842452 RepID=UPI001C0AECF2|nr:rhomboid family intramembrane serine protease [Aestuariicella albida]MBU3070539.1 rhomboid family intramembrane serine protease [Aestuariicella albida]
MNWYKVDLFALSLDLSPLLTQLQQKGILYRVTEEPKGQCLWLDDQQQAEQLREFIRQNGLDSISPPSMAESSHRNTASLQDGEQFLTRKLVDFHGALGRYPVTLLTLLLGVLGALLVHYDQQLDWVSWLTFQPVRVMGEYLGLASVGAGLEAGQYWRLITPIFLHFGLFHILFNAMWIWEFGRRIEIGLGSFALTALILLIGIASNLTQYLWGGPSLFGGLSGVLYGLMGFLWIYNRFKPHPVFTLQPGIVGFMLVWVVLGMTGAVDFFMDGSIANAAHVGGLISGMLIAVIVAMRK